MRETGINSPPLSNQILDVEEFWNELGRLGRLGEVERRALDRGVGRIAGVDEAGRGAFAGPVVAAAVVLPPETTLPGLDDSKNLDRERRSWLARLIRKVATVGVGVVPATAVDGWDVLRATRVAAGRALSEISGRFEAIVTDALELPARIEPVVPVVGADARIAAVAAASVVAKDLRDSLMSDWDRRFPWYGFARHQGYGTPEHRQALLRHGPSPIHRLSFRGVLPLRAAA